MIYNINIYIYSIIYNNPGRGNRLSIYEKWQKRKECGYKEGVGAKRLAGDWYNLIYQLHKGVITILPTGNPPHGRLCFPKTVIPMYSAFSKCASNTVTY
jgi:hypothetical protein